MKTIILEAVAVVLSNLGAIGGGVYVGHRFAPLIDKLYVAVETVVSKVYSIVKPAAKAAATIVSK